MLGNNTDKKLYISLPRVLRAISSESLFGIIDFHISRKGTPVVIDASETKFIDSSAIGKMIILSKRLSEKGHKLVISNASNDLRNYLRQLRIDSLFHIT
ncbi:MAG: STAS domain-containing protein [bacterium]